MYENYFGLSERPFSIAPDPQYLYMSMHHKEAMAHLSYGLTQGGCFIVLTGEVGTGKTTLCRNLLHDLPDNVDVALILNANINEFELLQNLCDELGIQYPQQASQKQLLDAINAHLLQAFSENRHTVLIIDEAQLLNRDVLEQIRLLTNLETTKTKLLQIILIGQPELNTVLSREDLRQLAQRVTARYHLGELRASEIEDYVNHRLSVAGSKQPLFSRQALNKLYSLTQGIPRKINVLADHALLAAYSRSKQLVDANSVVSAAKDVFIPGNNEMGERRLNKAWLIAAFAVLLNIGLWWWFSTPLADKQFNTLTPNQSDVDALPHHLENEAAAPQAPTDNAGIQSYESGGSVQVAEQPLDDSIDIEAGEQPLIDLVNETMTSSVPFSESLQAATDKTGYINAIRILADLWNRQLPATLFAEPCEAAAVQGLQCLQVTDWSKIQSYNRPAILVLSHNQHLHRVILETIQADKAIVLLGEKRHQVAAAKLQAMWAQDGLILWQPKGLPRVLRQGDNGRHIVNARVLVNQALAKLQLPLLKDLDNPVYNTDMSQKVFLLQNRYGLNQDGIIGNETWLLLNEILSPETTLVLRRRI